MPQAWCLRIAPRDAPTVILPGLLLGLHFNGCGVFKSILARICCCKACTSLQWNIWELWTFWPTTLRLLLQIPSPYWWECWGSVKSSHWLQVLYASAKPQVGHQKMTNILHSPDYETYWLLTASKGSYHPDKRFIRTSACHVPTLWLHRKKAM